MKTKRKWFIVLMVIMATVATITLLPNQVSADTRVKINITNFPDKELRQIIKEKCDRNKDGYLSQKEIKKTTALTIDKHKMSHDYDYGRRTKKVIKQLEAYRNLDCKGLQYFVNLKELAIRVDIPRGKEETSKIKNIKYVYCLKNIKILDIYGDSELKKIDLKNLKNLKKLTVYATNIKKINLKENKKLTNVYIIGNHKLKKLDLSNSGKLKTVKCYWNNISEVKLPKKNKIVSLKLHFNNLSKFSTKRLNPETLKYFVISDPCLKKIDISHLKKLKTLEVWEKTKVIKSENQNFKQKTLLVNDFYGE